MGRRVFARSRTMSCRPSFEDGGQRVRAKARPDDKLRRRLPPERAQMRYGPGMRPGMPEREDTPLPALTSSQMEGRHHRRARPWRG